MNFPWDLGMINRDLASLRVARDNFASWLVQRKASWLVQRKAARRLAAGVGPGGVAANGVGATALSRLQAPGEDPAAAVRADTATQRSVKVGEEQGGQSFAKVGNEGGREGRGRVQSS